MLADFRARGGRLKLNYFNLPKGPVIDYISKMALPLSEKVNGENGTAKSMETESPKKKPAKAMLSLKKFVYLCLHDLYIFIIHIIIFINIYIAIYCRYTFLW